MRFHLPPNVRLRLTGTIRQRGDSFVLEMDDVDTASQPVVRVFLLSEDDDEMLAQVQGSVDQLAIVEGRWQPDVDEPATSGLLKVTQILRPPETRQ